MYALMRMLILKMLEKGISKYNSLQGKANYPYPPMSVLNFI